MFSFYASWWSIKGKGETEEDMDRSSKVRYEDVQPI